MKAVATMIAVAAMYGGAACATTMPVYIPGGAPCNGACTYEWATKTADVPDGKPEPMTVPAGSVVVWMSYAEQGKPYWQTKPMVLGVEEPAIGYWFKKDNQWYMMAQLDACKNWAVFLPPATKPLAAMAIVPPPLYQTFIPNNPPYVRPPGDPYLPPPVFPPPIVCDVCFPPPPPVCTECNPPPPPVVPVPLASWLMATWIGAALLLARRMRT